MAEARRSNAVVHDLFLEQVARTPDAVALDLEHGVMTYAQLDERSSGLAARLQRCGVGPEVRVAICMERSPEMIVSLLAILRAGGAYVPLDPTHPGARLAYMLADSGAALVLTAGRGADDVPHTAPAVKVDLADLRRDAPTPIVFPVAHPDSLAYVIYTSGSSGRPKGVAAAHRGLANLALDQICRWGVGPGTRILQFASLSFDASFTEIAVALLSGATLCLAEAGDLVPGPELRDLLRRRRINAVKAPPAVLARLPTDDLPDLELVVNGGGPCSPALVRRWSPGRTFLNAYGATECSVCSTTTGPLGVGVPTTLGHPVANTSIHVLDRDLEPVPAGTVGEIWIGGLGVTRGYWERPAITAERFLPDPHGEPGSRAYRTGDLGRVLAAGGVEFVGRIDRQVKVRGHRIEPEEIAAAVRAHHAVREAAVKAWPAADGEVRLAAYVEAEPGVVVTRRELIAHMRLVLPHHMLPPALVFMDVLPLTPNRKIDLDRLPPPGPPGLDRGAVHVAPRSADERLVAEVWGESLGVASVGLTANFFELGGDSLAAARAIARLREVTGVELPLRALLEGPTVAALARALTRARATA